jgi:hypothetical protein
MNAADVELARMAYIASALGVLLFASIMLRGLWRPLRFWLLALVLSFFFTPFFLPQAMPDGKDQNMLPAFIVLFHDVANDREHWREAIQHAGKPIAAMAGVTSLIAFVLAILLPKPAKKIKPANASKEKPAKKTRKNPYLPEDFQPQ